VATGAVGPSGSGPTETGVVGPMGSGALESGIVFGPAVVAAGGADGAEGAGGGVGAEGGVGGAGAPPVGGGVGGAVDGTGAVEPFGATGPDSSLGARRLMRTVSFLRGTVEVLTVGLAGSWSDGSLMRETNRQIF